MEKPWVGILTGLPRQPSTVRRAEPPDPPLPWRRASAASPRYSQDWTGRRAKVAIPRVSACRGHVTTLRLGSATLGQARRLEHALPIRLGIAHGSGWRESVRRHVHRSGRLRRRAWIDLAPAPACRLPKRPRKR